MFAAVGGFFLDLSLAIALLAGLSLLGVAAMGFVQGLRGIGSAQIALDPLLLVVVSLIATAISALFVYYFRRNANTVERAESWRALWRRSSWGWIAFALIVCSGYSAVVSTFAQKMAIDITPTNQVLGEIIRTHPRSLLIFAVLIAPAYEELLFRRVLFGRLWAAGRPWLGMALSSAAFALVHEPPGLGASSGWGMLLLWSVYALMGALFAWIYRRTGSLWTAYLAHAGNNLIACLALLA
ncbi:MULTISPECIES: type II CAAX endopeptidase family protein [unclassified Lysobacter]|uniref:CPBP family intramembrane glutamic endopeptidase n=1 Tax=unclassified Lysobacter TaxID=2635362 RepID=UPI0020364A26|nr:MULTISPECIES: type II CAAX endopeptidase family protein [unclassified Lysobacter]